MPLYEYVCKKCGHRLEVIQKFSDDPLKKCPECGGVLEKVVSAPAFHLKGSGWYKTDYASNKGGGAKTSSESDPKPEKSEKKDSAEGKTSKESTPTSSDSKK